MSDDSTIVITNIKDLLKTNKENSKDSPPCLVAIGGPLNGTLFDLLSPEILFGRSTEATYSLEVTGISRSHFRILLQKEAVLVEDLGSKNGTYLNDQALSAKTPTVLKRYDVIKLGELSLKFLPAGDSERASFEKLHREANTDKHTGCFNKTYFNQALEKHFQKTKILGKPLSLIIFDIDHFKKLNDTYGHDAGDFILKEMAFLVKQKGVREGDIFARFGGEEFVSLLPETTAKMAEEIAERIRKLLEASSFNYTSQVLSITVSIGVAEINPSMLNSTDLFKAADEAVYEAKRGGRNQVRVYSQKNHVAA